MRAYLINLDRSPQRLALMRAALAATGVGFERVAGVDGAALTEDARRIFAEARCAAQPAGWMPGEIGCFLSHFAVWERIAAGADPWAAVLEDDLRVADDLGVLLRSAGWIPPGADIVRLEANRPMRLGRGRPIEGTHRRQVHAALSGSPGSAAYVVSKEAAQRLVASAPQTHASVDVFLFKPKMSAVAASLARFQVVPAPCVQDGVAAAPQEGLESLIRKRASRGRAYRETLNPLFRLWPMRRYAVPFRP